MKRKKRKFQGEDKKTSCMGRNRLPDRFKYLNSLGGGWGFHGVGLKKRLKDGQNCEKGGRITYRGDFHGQTRNTYEVEVLFNLRQI